MVTDPDTRLQRMEHPPGGGNNPMSKQKNTAAIKAAANLSGNDHLLVAILFQLYLYCVNGAEQGILKSITHL